MWGKEKNITPNFSRAQIRFRAFRWGKYHHPPAGREYHTWLERVLWLLQSKMQNRKRDFCFAKKDVANLQFFMTKASSSYHFLLWYGGNLPCISANQCTCWNIASAAPAEPFQALLMQSFVSEGWQNGAFQLANLLGCTTVFQTLRASCLGSKALKYCK